MMNQARVMAFLLVTSVAADAQVPRAFAFPDTLGANFAIADSAKGLGTQQDYEFLEGVWRYRFQQRRPDGQWNNPFEGTWVSTMKPNGFLLVDQWRADNATQSGETGTYSFRKFIPGRKVWEMYGTGTGSGPWNPGLSWSDSSSRYVIQRFGPALMRIRYFNITANSFQWRADMTQDGGKTWILDHWIMEARRIGR